MATTRKDLRQRIGGVEFCGDMILSTAMSGSGASTLVDTKLTATNDTYNYAWLAMVGGLASGDRRVIADWVQATGTFTPDRNFSAAVANGDAYELHRLFSPDDKDAAINAAINASQRKWLLHQEDATLVIVADTYQYALASITPAMDRTLGIDHIEQYQTSAARWARVHPEAWWLADDNGTLYLRFHPDALPPVGATLRLTYRTRPATLATDAATLAPDEVDFANYICAKATAMLFQKKAHLAEETAREHWQMNADRMEQKAEAFLAQAQHHAPKPQQMTSGW